MRLFQLCRTRHGSTAAVHCGMHASEGCLSGMAHARPRTHPSCCGLQVRTAIACQLHAVARTVAAADAARLLQRPLVALLRDSSTAVREALLPGLGETFRVR